MSKLFDETLSDPKLIKAYGCAVLQLFSLMHSLEDLGADEEASFCIIDAVEVLTDQLRGAIDRKEEVEELLRGLHDKR